VGRIHYDYIAYVGCRGPDVAAAYGTARNRCDLRRGGVAVFVGAGGPMGQMHVQRALEMPDGPATIVASDLSADRLAALEGALGGLAKARGKALVTLLPTPERTLAAEVARHAGARGADDVVVTVPVAAVMADAAALLADDGMLVFFAGVPNGTFAPLELGHVYLGNAQFTGTSGSALADQAVVIRKAQEGALSPNRSVGAIGGLDAAVDGMTAMMEGRFPGKIVIFPQVRGLPLTGLRELAERDPDLARHLGPGGTWSTEAERALIERYGSP
jgi:threonine dehydrogenase-like Zn-dependent dehydrogenase